MFGMTVFGSSRRLPEGVLPAEPSVTSMVGGVRWKSGGNATVPLARLDKCLSRQGVLQAARRHGVSARQVDEAGSFRCGDAMEPICCVWGIYREPVHVAFLRQCANHVRPGPVYRGSVK